LKGCIRAEKINDPEVFIPSILNKVKKENLKKLYDIEDWADEDDFIMKVG